MLMTAIALFALTALLGVYLFSFIIQKKETPKGVTFTHGPLGATSIVVLLIYTFIYTPKPIYSLIVFILAACGGLYLALRDITGKVPPWWMAAGHGLVAVVGFALLLWFAFV